MKILEVEQIFLDCPFKIQVHIRLDPFHCPNPDSTPAFPPQYFKHEWNVAKKASRGLVSNV